MYLKHQRVKSFSFESFCKLKTLKTSHTQTHRHTYPLRSELNMIRSSSASGRQERDELAMDSRSGSADISEDCGELSRLRRERHMLLLRVSAGRINVVPGGGMRRGKRRRKYLCRATFAVTKHRRALPPRSPVNCGMMGGVSSSRSSTPPAMGQGGTETRGITTQLWSE